MEKTVELPYGTTIKEFDISDFKLLGILKSNRYPEIEDPREVIYNAIKNPNYGLPLRELAKNKKSAAILVSDKTRRTYIKEILPILLEELARDGIPLGKIVIIIAVGAHPLLTEEEIQSLVGEDIVNNVTVMNHNCRDISSLEYRGISSRGTPVFLNKFFLEADLKILTGAINYHDFAGFSGGAKSILPGISGSNTISHNHLLLLNPVFGAGYNPLATAGNIEGNPVHEDMEEIAGLLDPDFLINVVFNADGKLCRVVSGNWKLAHRAGCKTVEEIFSAKVKEKADVVLVSAGGYPFDINLYQAMKSVINTMNIVKDDGFIILVSECSEGLGTENLKEWLNIEPPERLEEELRKDFNMIGKIAYDIKIGLKEKKVLMISDLSEKDIKLLGFRKINTLEEVKDVISLKRETSLYVVPYGNITLPKLISSL